MGVRVAPHHDGGELGHAQIALAQFDALAFGQIDRLLDRPLREPRIARMRDRLFLDGGVHNDPLEIFGLDRPVRCATEGFPGIPALRAALFDGRERCRS